MSIPRRTILGFLAGAGLLPRLFARAFLFEVDRILDEIPQSRATLCQRRYGAKATITVLSIPVVSRAGVGSGYIAIQQSSAEDDTAGTGGRTVGIQFGAGSRPEAARGLNRLGFIQEGIVEDRSGQLLECAYFAFMTTSQEENLDQAKKALDSSDGAIPYVAAEGGGRPGKFSSRLHRIGFSSRLTWRDCSLLVDKVRAAVASEAPAQKIEKTLSAHQAAPSTFLYAVWKAILDPDPATTGSLIYNGKEFELRTAKETDTVASAHFRTINLVREGGAVIRLNAFLREYATGRQTPFKVWYEAGSEHMPPLRFEYQARPFLRLTFEYDPAASGPDIGGSLKDSRVHFHWQEKNLHTNFRTGVSIHSHTLYSRESMDFIVRATENTPWLSGAIRKQREKYRAEKGRELDFNRAWWTPPLSPLHAWKLEKSQIENGLDREALISLTDHDNIDAGLHLSMLDETQSCPVSVEWTIPYRETFFHIGVHNLPLREATTIMRDMAALTANPAEERIGPLLEFLHSSAQTLIVFNHPLWDENHVGPSRHRDCVDSFLARFGQFIHALELNGLRPWRENGPVAQLAASVSLPLISGGDRHGREPNACVNLTNATTFPEFVEEIRRDGWSDVLFMPQYREPLKLRILQNMCDILENDDRHSMGWTQWSDRVFYLTDEGIEKSLNKLWGARFPAVVNRFVGLMGLVKHRRVLSALKFALTEGQEFAL